MENDEIKTSLKKFKRERAKIEDLISKTEKQCQHEWAYGDMGGPIVYCTICNKDIQDVYKNISGKDINKLMAK